MENKIAPVSPGNNTAPLSKATQNPSPAAISLNKVAHKNVADEEARRRRRREEFERGVKVSQAAIRNFMRTRQQQIQAVCVVKDVATTANKQSKDIAGGNEESGHKDEKEHEKKVREIVKESKDTKEKTNEESEEMIDTISELNDLDTYLRALEEGRKFGTINLPALGLTDDDLSCLLTKMQRTAPTIGSSISCQFISSLILDANDIEAQGAREIAEYLMTSNNIRSISLKWNMIGTRGAESVAEALKVNRSLATLQLEGNGIDVDGTIAIADALKVNKGITDLNLKENSLCDEGAEALAQALQVNSTLNRLDLSSNSIGRNGAIKLADSIQNSCVLRFLLLNMNPLCDEGALALANCLKQNTFLTSLELKDTYITEQGILELVTALKINTTLNHLNIMLNQPGLSGEIGLTELQQKLPAREILWKDSEVQTPWEPHECQAIINHFGVDKILRTLMKGQSLVPLISDHLLVTHLHIPSCETANWFLNSVFSEGIGTKNVGIDLLMKILLKLINKAAITDKQQMPVLLQVLHDKMEYLFSFLRMPTLCNWERWRSGEQASLQIGHPLYERPVPPIGSFRLKVLELMPLLVHLNYGPLDCQLILSKAAHICLDLFFSYPWNNFIHHRVADFLIAMLSSNRQALINEVITNCNLLHKIMTVLKFEGAKTPALRSGLVGHLIQMANTLSSPPLNAMIHRDTEWQTFVDCELRLLNQTFTEWSFGKPDRSSPAYASQTTAATKHVNEDPYFS